VHQDASKVLTECQTDEQAKWNSRGLDRATGHPLGGECGCKGGAGVGVEG